MGEGVWNPFEIHERSIRQVSMIASSTNKLPWAVFWTNGTSEEGTFLSFVPFPYQYWFRNAIILSVDQRFNACRIGRSGNFSLQQDWIIIWSKPELFLFNQTKRCWLPILVIYFLRSTFGLLYPLFLSYHLGKIVFVPSGGLASVGPFKSSILCRSINWVIFFSSQRLKFRTPWNLHGSESSRLKYCI